MTEDRAQLPSHSYAQYRALNGENSPVVVCDSDEPGTVMAVVGRQQDAEEIATALNGYQGAVDALRKIADGTYPDTTAKRGHRNFGPRMLRKIAADALDRFGGQL